MIKIIEHKIIKEAYDDSAPSWIKDFLVLNGINSGLASYFGTEYDLGHAEWHEESVPTSPSDIRLKDKNRISFFLVPNAKRFYNRKLRKMELYPVIFSYDADSGYSNPWKPSLETLGLRRNASFKTLLPLFTKYAWIEKSSNRQNAKDIHDKRRELQDGAVALQREMSGWWLDKDKSGYIVDKDKYKKLLVSKKASKIIQTTYDEINDYITKSKEAINNFVNNMSSNDDIYKFKSKEAFSCLSNLFYYANQCNEWLSQLDKGQKLDDVSIYELSKKMSKEYKKLLSYIPQ